MKYGRINRYVKVALITLPLRAAIQENFKTSTSKKLQSEKRTNLLTEKSFKMI